MQRTCDLEVTEIKRCEEYFDIEYDFYSENMERGKVRSFLLSCSWSKDSVKKFI